MASCPNCGRRTQRTKDWVCEWCGYPLLYGNFKQIDKTFKELQEERNTSWQAEKEEPEIEVEEEAEPEPEPPREPIWKQKKAPRPSYPQKRETEPEPEPAPLPRPKYEPPQRPTPIAKEPLFKPRPEPVLLPKLETPPKAAPQPTAPEANPRIEILPRVQPEATPPAEHPPIFQRPAAQPRPEPPPLRMEPPRPAPELKAEPIKVPSLESIKDGAQLTIDQIDALFRTDNIGTNEALKEKTIIVKGIVTKVFIRDHLDVRYLILGGAGKVIWSARCQFEKEDAGPMGRLSEGQEVALKGKYDGYGKNIIFKSCSMVGGGS